MKNIDKNTYKGWELIKLAYEGILEIGDTFISSSGKEIEVRNCNGNLYFKDINEKKELSNKELINSEVFLYLKNNKIYRYVDPKYIIGTERFLLANYPNIHAFLAKNYPESIITFSGDGDCMISLSYFEKNNN